uniref:Cyclin-like domain-containing protein n=1 Tax=Strigamia maritima TaxID=126957 RepID=T1J0D3_STRMM
MAKEERWYFPKDELQNTVSRKAGIDADKELSYRQQAANFIQDMGIRLPVYPFVYATLTRDLVLPLVFINQLCINTAIVYMHRFYMFHPFSRFHRNAIATCALFLAAKVEEQPRKLEHVIKVGQMCLYGSAPVDSSEAYLEQAQQLVMNENVMLQTLGFDVAIDHPHTHIVKCCQLVRASKDLAQTSYIMATTSLHLTTMCLQYKPTVVACVCIHLACKWANWEIPCSSEGKNWFWYVDKAVTLELLRELTAEFLAILDKCPSRLKKTLMSASCGKQEGGASRRLRADVLAVGNSLLSGLTSSSSSNYSEKSCSPIVPHKSDKHGDAGDSCDAMKHSDFSEIATIEKMARSEKQNEAMMKHAAAFSHHHNLAAGERAALKDQTLASVKPQPVPHPVGHHSRTSVEPKLPALASAAPKKNHRSEKVKTPIAIKEKERVDKMAAHSNKYFKSNSPTAGARHDKMRHKKDTDAAVSNHMNPSNLLCPNGKESTNKLIPVEIKSPRLPEHELVTQRTEPEEELSTIDAKCLRLPVSESNIQAAVRQAIRLEKQSVEPMILPLDVPKHPGERVRQPQERHEKREKHKHREKMSKHANAAQSAPSAQQMANPRIKLTIPKERLNAPIESNGGGATTKPDTGIKLKLSKQMYTAPQPKDLASSSGGGEALKLKIKLPKAAKTGYEVKNERKREAEAPLNPTTSPKVPRMETRLSRKEDDETTTYYNMAAQQQQRLQSLMNVNPYLQQQELEQHKLLPTVDLSANNVLSHHRNKMAPQYNVNPQQNCVRKQKNHSRSQRSLPPMQMPQQQHSFQQINAGPYPYTQFFPVHNMMGGFYPPQQLGAPRPPMQQVEGHSFHHGPSLGPPPLPRDPPPPMPPPPPE